MSGQIGYLAGLAAEDIVTRNYLRDGRTLLARRWRGQSGEIDLIFNEGDAVIFVEVKKSRSFAQAATRLGAAQMARIANAAAEFLGTQPRGQLTDCRFDLAIVNGQGVCDVIPNAFGGA